MPQHARAVESVSRAENAPIRTGTLLPDELLTTGDLMRFLKVRHPRTIYRLIAKGLPKVVVGNKYRYIKQEVMEFLRSRSGGRGVNRK